MTLLGLISKHGILIVEVANELQRHGRPRRAAVEQGAGALSRFSMGLVISTGIAIGTLFTLFVVPAVYLMLTARHEAALAADAGAPVARG
ncbi:MAG: hypothetical protein KIT25_05160 [Enhydrobacter sp.]|nr:MAG: hypothetical protein KIT25_05160 [Enhydrobacter sp.]